MADTAIVHNGEVTLNLSTDKRSLSCALCMATELVKDRLSQEDQLRFQIALQELLMNAFEHGNCGITSEEKVKLCDLGQLEFEHEKLSKVARENSKMIRFSAKLATRLFTCVIGDDGEGFDWRANSRSGDSTADLLAPSGRGLNIAHAMFDEIRFNDTGNEVTAVKNLRR